MKSFLHNFILLYTVLVVCIISVPSSAGIIRIETLDSLDLTGNTMLKSLRKDIKDSIHIIRSFNSSEKLPELQFFKYRVKKADSFWKILSRSSLDMDTLISVNSLSTPRDVYPGKTIHIPNMRGIVISGSKKNEIFKILEKNKIEIEYLYKVNRCRDFDKKYLFIPCGKVSNLERSLFFGTGFIYPLKSGRRTSGFGTRRNPFNTKCFQFHTGIDIACPIRTKIYAARNGNVIFSGIKGGYGRLVIIEHEYGYKSYYGHLSRSLVKTGQRVKMGEIVALSGNTGRTTGPHLHFEIRKKGRPVNPSIFIRGRTK